MLYIFQRRCKIRNINKMYHDSVSGLERARYALKPKKFNVKSHLNLANLRYLMFTDPLLVLWYATVVAKNLLVTRRKPVSIIQQLIFSRTWHHWGFIAPLPLNLAPLLIPKLQVPLNLSGRTFSYFRPPYQYLCRTSLLPPNTSVWSNNTRLN